MSDNWRESEFREFLISKFYGQTEMSDQRVEDVAEKMGMTKWGLYKIIDGTTVLKPELIPRLYNATGDIDYIMWFVNRCKGLKLIKMPNTGQLNGTISDEIIQAGSEHGDLCQKWLEYFADGKIDEREKQQLLKEIRKQEQTLNLMREEIKNL